MRGTSLRIAGRAAEMHAHAPSCRLGSDTGPREGLISPTQPAVADRDTGPADTYTHPRPYLNVQQACRLLQVGRSTFYRILADPSSGLADVALRIPVVGRMRFPERKLRRWLEGRVRREADTKESA